MSRAGLSKYGIRPPDAIREVARNRSGAEVCAECGDVVVDSLGSQRVWSPDVVDDVALRLENTLITYGWRCCKHTADVVMPLRVSSSECVEMPARGWFGVRVRAADGRVLLVPTPAVEIDGGDGA